MQSLYAALALVGAALPLSQFLPWLAEHGLALPVLVQHAIAHPVSAFAWADVFVSGVVVIALVIIEGRRQRMRHLWIPLAALLVGPSLALPLFLLMRERHLSAGRAES